MDARDGTEPTCPDCGWPDAEVYEVVSRHPVSTGLLLYTRCPCGRLRAHPVPVPGTGRGGARR
ncbi:hypothetical protein [Nocardiopsis trehalosi]|jgi:hypothetical protein|uniref:hypothetical protein n=1 Tax=Nocardiopsis trehalosi TaxID=109329 RepID=UPI0008344A32|nr:hypothetical protein [Nocardiopsis trehalosi]